MGMNNPVMVGKSREKDGLAFEIRACLGVADYISAWSWLTLSVATSENSKCTRKGLRV